MLFKSNKPHYEYLRKKWVAKHKDLTQNLFDKHLKKVAITGLGGLMLLSSPGVNVQSAHNLADEAVKIDTGTDNRSLLVNQLKGKVPTEVRTLNADENKQLEAILSESFNLSIKTEIDYKRLNKTYGLIGGEQHLYRYPGDTVYGHADTAQDWAMYGGSGIAPGRGAWGYFAGSKEQMDQKAIDRERWYIAVQTFLSPGFSERVAEYRDFYKYRKMLLVNPATGQAVVADIGDAGPAEFTGKSLGGSPEVMEAVGLARGPRKGAVLYYFIDDPNDQVPLGPIKVTDQLEKKLASIK